MIFSLRHIVGALCLTALSGCSIVPGLHIHAPEKYGQKGSSTEVVSENEQVIRLNQPDGAVGSIRVITLNNQTLTSINQTLGVIPATSGLPEIPAPEYTLGPGDVVNVVVWDHPELTSPSGGTAGGGDISAGRLIDAQGRLYYPYVGTVQVSGLTVGDLRNLLINRLARVIQNPQVDVRVSQFRSQKVQVTGQVKTPGLVPLDDTSKGVIDAINERGGLADNASRRQIEVVRAGKTHLLDAQQAIANKGAVSNPRLLSGDVVFVPDRSQDQIFVLGNVKNEGPVYLESGRTTLVQVLAASAGLDRISGDDSGVLLFRRPNQPGDVATVIKLDMSTPLGLILAGETELQPRDVVYVSATAFSKYNAIVNQLLPTISAVFQTDALIRRIGGE